MTVDWAEPALATALWTAGTLLVLATRRFRADLVALLSLAAGAAGGLVPADAATAGFTGATAFVLAASAVLAAALDRAGLTAWPTRIAGRRTTPRTRDLAGLGITAAFGAALTGRNGTRAVLFRAVAGEAEPAVLHPVVAVGCLLGGTATLVGGVPNLVVSDLRGRVTGQPFAPLDFLPVGAALCMAALLLLLVAARPARAVVAPAGTATPEGSGKGYTSEVMVPAHAALVGRTVSALEAAEDGNLHVLALVREGFRRIAPRPHWPVEAGDVLVLGCEPDVLQRWMERYGLRIVGGSRSGGHEEAGVVEAVVTPASELVGRTPGDARLESRFGISLLAIGRGGSPPAGRLHRTKLRAGDVVVFQGRLDTMVATLGALGCLKLAERRLRLGGQRGSALPPVLLLAAMAGAVAGIVPLWLALLVASLLCVVAAVLDPAEAYDAVPWPTLVTVGGLLPMGVALTDSGAAGIVAGWVAPVAQAVGAMGTVAGLLVVTVAGVVAVGTAAAAIVLAPVAMALAVAAGMPGDMLLMAVAVGASVNMLVPGGIGLSGHRAIVPHRMALATAALVLVVGTATIPLVWGGR